VPGSVRTRRRPSVRATLKPHAPSLRLAIGIRPAEVARIAGVPDGVIGDVELGWIRGGPDEFFLIDIYLDVARNLAHVGRVPPMIKHQERTTALTELRLALGLGFPTGAAVAGVTERQYRELESFTASVADGRREGAWCLMARWAWRRWYAQSDPRGRRLRREEVERTRAISELHARVFQAEEERRAIVRMHRLAYAPRMSPEQAEKEALRLLGVEQAG